MLYVPMVELLFLIGNVNTVFIFMMKNISASKKRLLFLIGNVNTLQKEILIYTKMSTMLLFLISNVNTEIRNHVH